jgi:hypothetical protein
VFIWSDVTDTTAGDFLYLAGVQLEAGSVATPFERRPYGTELQLAMRYYFRNTAISAFQCFGSGIATTATNMNAAIPLPVQMRATPTLESGGIIGTINASGTVISLASAPSISGVSSNANVAYLSGAVASGLVAGNSTGLFANSSVSAFLGFSSEL